MQLIRFVIFTFLLTFLNLGYAETYYFTITPSSPVHVKLTWTDIAYVKYNLSNGNTFRQLSCEATPESTGHPLLQYNRKNQGYTAYLPVTLNERNMNVNDQFQLLMGKFDWDKTSDITCQLK